MIKLNLNSNVNPHQHNGEKDFQFFANSSGHKNYPTQDLYSI